MPYQLLYMTGSQHLTMLQSLTAGNAFAGIRQHATYCLCTLSDSISGSDSCSVSAGTTQHAAGAQHPAMLQRLTAYVI